MDPRTLLSARQAEQRAPGQWFAIDGDTVHVCAGRDAPHTFCGEAINAGWEFSDMTRWQTGWRICENCGQCAAELEGLAKPSP